MSQKLLFYFLLLICSAVYWQIGGKRTYGFLNFVTSPRQAVLGEKVITIYDEDVNQALFNPAAKSYSRYALAENASLFGLIVNFWE